MAPLNPYSSWFNREIDETRQPHSHWFFVCEGSETEQIYFESLFTVLDEMDLPGSAEGVYIERTGEDETVSHPKRLLQYAEAVTRNELREYDYDDQVDTIIIVFDVDIYKDCEEEYHAYLKEVRSKGFIPAVTNPSFALYLLLHQNDAYAKLVVPNKNDILENKKVSKAYRFVEKLFSDTYETNAKHGKDIGPLSHRHQIACAEEQNLNNDPDTALGQLTSNIGVIIEQFKEAK